MSKEVDGLAEALVNLMSAASTEPIAGLAGIVDTLMNDPKSGARTVEEPKLVVDNKSVIKKPKKKKKKKKKKKDD